MATTQEQLDLFNQRVLAATLYDSADADRQRTPTPTDRAFGQFAYHTDPTVHRTRFVTAADYQRLAGQTISPAQAQVQIQASVQAMQAIERQLQDPTLSWPTRQQLQAQLQALQAQGRSAIAASANERDVWATRGEPLHDLDASPVEGALARMLEARGTKLDLQTLAPAYRMTQRRSPALSPDYSYAYVLGHTFDQSHPIARHYFTKRNLDDVQRMLRYKVYELSQKRYVIERQNDHAVLGRMANTFRQYGMFPETEDPRQLQRETDRLNALLLSELAPDVAAEVDMYMTYLRDASTLPEPLPRPINVSQRGTKEGRAVTDVLVTGAMGFTQRPVV